MVLAPESFPGRSDRFLRLSITSARLQEKRRRALAKARKVLALYENTPRTRNAGASMILHLPARIIRRIDQITNRSQFLPSLLRRIYEFKPEHTTTCALTRNQCRLCIGRSRC